MMAQIPLGKGKFAEVDEEDVVWLSFISFIWHLDKDGYARGSSDNAHVWMHLLIAKKMGLDVTKDVDHKDRNRLNNRKENLRAATRSQTNANQTKHTGKLSKGVRFNLKSGMYTAQITKNGKCYNSCGHLSEESAQKAYASLARELFGEFACEG